MADIVTPASIDIGASFEASGVGPVLEQLDRELVGLKPVKRRIRNNALVLMALALAFYVAFIAMSVLRGRH